MIKNLLESYKNSIRNFISCFLLLLVIIFSIIPFPLSTPSSYSDYPIDKLFHFLSYALLTILFSKPHKMQAYLRLGVSLFILGFSLEVIQGYTLYRAFELYDLFANVSGIIVGIIISNFILRRIYD